MNAAVAAPTEPRGLNVQRRLVEIGRIRLGEKGTKGEPKKLSKFRLTSASRNVLEAAARVYGGTVRSWQGAPDEGMWELFTETDTLDIMVPPVLNAYSQYYEEWSGGTCNLRCDGRWDSINEVECAHGDHEGMKVTTRVSVILPKLPGLGVWRLETHGWNAAATLPSSLDLIGATRAWIPAVIRLEQKSSRTRDEKTKRVLVRRFVVPVVDLVGASFGELLASGGATDAYAEPAPALGAGPGSLALPAGPSATRGTARVPRPEMAPEPALDDEAAAFSGPVSRPFPEDDGVFGPATPPAAPVDDHDVDLAVAIRELAAASKLTGEPSDAQRGALVQVFAGLPAQATLAGIVALWPDAAADGRAHLTAAQADGILAVAETMDPAALRAVWPKLGAA
jgi:hypothetical protein